MGGIPDQVASSCGSHRFEPGAVVQSIHMENIESSLTEQQTEPVRTPENLPQTEWLTVDEAVSLCAEHGLSRTPKTLRKWAERSFQKEDAEIIVRREDTMWAYRWKFEKTSLVRKIEQEVSLSSSNTSEPVRTSPNEGSHTHQAQDDFLSGSRKPHPFEPVSTSSQEGSEHDPVKPDKPGSNDSKPVRTSSHQTGDLDGVLEEVRERLADKNREVEFLRGQLEIAQAEVGRRATSTDEALKTIDRVVHSFELQAEANRALALRDAGGAASEAATEEVRFAPESIEHERDETPSTERDYQQPSTYVG